ncbi:MAG TPA: hypothetical protein VGJ44_02325, partial [Kribbellaceae bacterium]
MAGAISDAVTVTSSSDGASGPADAPLVGSGGLPLPPVVSRMAQTDAGSPATEPGDVVPQDLPVRATPSSAPSGSETTPGSATDASTPLVGSGEMPPVVSRMARTDTGSSPAGSRDAGSSASASRDSGSYDSGGPDEHTAADLPVRPAERSGTPGNDGVVPEAVVPTTPVEFAAPAMITDVPVPATPAEVVQRTSATPSPTPSGADAAVRPEPPAGPVSMPPLPVVSRSVANPAERSPGPAGPGSPPAAPQTGMPTEVPLIGSTGFSPFVAALGRPDEPAPDAQDLAVVARTTGVAESLPASGPAAIVASGNDDGAEAVVQRTSVSAPLPVAPPALLWPPPVPRTARSEPAADLPLTSEQPLTLQHDPGEHVATPPPVQRVSYDVPAQRSAGTGRTAPPAPLRTPPQEARPAPEAVAPEQPPLPVMRTAETEAQTVHAVPLQRMFGDLATQPAEPAQVAQWQAPVQRDQIPTSPVLVQTATEPGPAPDSGTPAASVVPAATP